MNTSPTFRDPTPADSSQDSPAPPADEGIDDHETSSWTRRVQHLLHAHPTLGPVAVLVLSIIAFSFANQRFLSAANLSLVVAQVTVIAVLALGQTLVILTAGIDLSVGAIAVFSSILMATLATRAGLPGVPALVVGLLLGTAMGAVNGIFVTKLRLPPFIVTLATLSIFFSLNYVVSRSETVRGSDMPSLLTWTGSVVHLGGFGLTFGSLIMVVMFATASYALRMTAWGKHVYATGDDVEAARLAGIRTDRVLLSVYTTAGAVYAVGAWILIGRLASASPNVGVEYNLDSITAVVLGGTSLFGGRGGVAGTLAGALIVGVFRNGLQLAGVQVVWQGVAIGLLVLTAVSIDQWIRKVKG
jgi:fructose transport system permease protein